MGATWREHDSITTGQYHYVTKELYVRITTGQNNYYQKKYATLSLRDKITTLKNSVMPTVLKIWRKNNFRAEGKIR